MHLPLRCVATLGLLLLVGIPVFARAEGDPAHQTVAAAYFEALFSGNPAQASRLATVPFSFDGKKILRSQKEVEQVHRDIAADKGARPIPKYTIARTDQAAALDPGVFPKYVVYRILIDDEGIDIYLTADDSPGVIGFND